MKRIAFLLVSIALAAACIEEPAPPADITGTWVAARTPGQTIFTQADTFRFELDQLGGEVHGSWQATGSSGFIVKPIATSGAVTGNDLVLNLTYDRLSNGCTIAMSACTPLFYRLFGEIDGAGDLQTHVIEVSSSGIPDPNPPILASWTLKRR